MSKPEHNILIKHADNIMRLIESHKIKSDASMYGSTPFTSIYTTAEKFCDLVSNIDIIICPIMFIETKHLERDKMHLYSFVK